MNFLDICIRVNKLSGLHGQMSDVNSTKDLQAQISNGVNESWIALQNLRKDWSFMIKRHQTFTCTQGEEIYVDYNANPAVLDVGIEDLGTYKRRGIFLDHEPLKFIEAARFPFIDNTKETKPKWFSIDPKNNDLYLNLPDDSYTFDIYYRKEVQDLFTPASTANTNEPELPSNYHNLLVYAGLSSFAVYIGNIELYNKYELMYQQGLGNLMREYLPSRRIIQRSII